MPVTSATSARSRLRPNEGHRERFRLVSDRPMPITSDSVVSLAQGMGGRICDLSPSYLDAVAESLVWAHPRSIFRRALLYALVSDRFRRSRHGTLAGLTPRLVRRLMREWELGLHRGEAAVE